LLYLYATSGKSSDKKRKSLKRQKQSVAGVGFGDDADGGGNRRQRGAFWVHVIAEFADREVAKARDRTWSSWKRALSNRTEWIYRACESLQRLFKVRGS
jgi:hypothetical protein